MTGPRLRTGLPSRRACLATLGLALFGARARAGTGPVAVGERIDWPALTLTDGHTLGAPDWTDRAAVVVFWATWCDFCRRHNARVERLHREAAGLHLRVLGVALDGDDGAVRRYMQSNGYHFPVVVGRPELRELFTARRVIPATCLVDRRGLLQQVIPGEMAESDVMGLAALANRPASGPGILHSSLPANKMFHG